MKRTSLTTAVIAGIAGVAGISNMASAVYLNNDGLGQVLIYPYYTVNGTNNTVITVVNTTQQTKAVKVRFLEAYDSREVLDFNLYLSPLDVWTAGIVPTGAGGAGVFTNDNSCTVPQLSNSSAAPQPFFNYAFTGRNYDGGPTDVSRTLEGYVELIEMATITNVNQSSAAAAKHAAGIPANCGQLRAAWAPGAGYWGISGTAPNTVDAAPPTGGLFGSGSIIDVPNGLLEGYNADAIDQFWVDPIPAPHHTQPGSTSPSIGDGTSNTSYVFTPGPVGVTPVLATTSYTLPIDAVSSLFMADSIYNEYWTSGGTAANSEWVVTFPTKRFYVDTAKVAVAQRPFDNLFQASNPADPTLTDGKSCSRIGISFTGREEEASIPNIGFSPPPPGAPSASLCYEAQVISFNQGGKSAILGSKLVRGITTPYNNGWAQIQLYISAAATPNHILPNTYTNGTAGATNQFYGQPVTGFWIAAVKNGTLPGGVLSNYSAAYRHKLHRTCASGATLAANCS